MNEIKLEKSCMAFTTKDGQTLLIHKDDIQQIANKVMIQVLLDHQIKGTLIVRHTEDLVAERIRTIRDVLKDKDLPEALRNDYYTEMLNLLKQQPITEVIQD